MLLLHCFDLRNAALHLLSGTDGLGERGNGVFNHQIKLLSCPLGSLVSLWNFETIRGSVMKPKWQKQASLAQEICTL